MRIAFDVDGVLADFESAVIEHARVLFGEPAETSPVRWSDRRLPAATPRHPAEARAQDSRRSASPHDQKLADLRGVRLNVRQRSRVWHRLESMEGFWESLSETRPGAVRRLADLARDRNWEVIFLTRRPPSAGSPAQIQTQRWLESKGFPLPSVYVVEGASRGRIAASLDLHVAVDDRVEHCVDIATHSSTRPILIWPGPAIMPPAVRRMKIEVARSIDQCLEVLATRNARGREQRNLASRLMRLLRVGREEAI